MAEARLASRVYATGSVLAMLAWAVEWYEGLITPWDRWLVPCMAVLFAVAATWLKLRPARQFWPKMLGTLVLNGYLVASTLLVVFVAPTPQQQYQLLTGLYWQPLGYAAAFLFLSARPALMLSVFVYGTMFVPLGLMVAAGRAETLGPSFVSLLGVMAVAQVGYIVMLLAVATMRASYHRANENLRVTEQLVNTDVLTGLMSRRACEAALGKALQHAAQTHTPLAAMLLDVDHFKRINDNHGHAAGDQALIDVGRLLSANLRGSDIVARWGGEEFLVLAPGSPIHTVQQLAERLRTAVEAFPFQHGKPVTLSIGIAQHLSGDDAHSLLARADRALYRAKNEGRNRCSTESLAVANGGRVPAQPDVVD